MQDISLTLATCRHVTQAATLCPKVDNFCTTHHGFMAIAHQQDMFLPQHLSFRSKHITATCPVCSRV